MKINVYQKIILILFLLSFVYFSIVHVPFKIDDGTIEYDTLFSNKSDLVTSRFILIIFIMAILAATLFLLGKNLSNNLNFSLLQRFKQKIVIKNKNDRVLIFFLIGVVLFILTCFSVYTINSYRFHYKRTQPTAAIIDSTAIKTDSTATTPTTDSVRLPQISEYELKKIENCTEENALRNFKKHMEFYYPDWKIYGKPKVKESDDCIYRIQFTTADPHMKYFVEKEIMIVEISFNDDFSKFHFKTVRGTLY